MLTNRRSQCAVLLVTLGVVSAAWTRSFDVPRRSDQAARVGDDRLSLEPEHSVVRNDQASAQRLVLRIRNGGSAPARIQGVTPHCGCTVAELPDDPIVAAGGTNTIALTV